MRFCPASVTISVFSNAREINNTPFPVGEKPTGFLWASSIPVPLLFSHSYGIL